MELKKNKDWVNNVSQQTLDRFKKAFILKCMEVGSDRLQVKYDELAKICGLSKGAVFKAVEVLTAEGFIERIPAQSRRIANTYVLKGPIKMDIPKNTDNLSFGSGSELINRVVNIRAKMNELVVENQNLKALSNSSHGGDVEVIAKNKLPGDFVQLIYKVNKDSESMHNNA
ncbi:MAG: helix-turn-helix domain-containing protein [Bacillota bacterium]|nr:helix-turn-helix domain-containing protein [Bacillota bacterium]